VVKLDCIGGYTSRAKPQVACLTSAVGLCRTGLLLKEGSFFKSEVEMELEEKGGDGVGEGGDGEHLQ
jgi:hypothetical protein